MALADVLCMAISMELYDENYSEYNTHIDKIVSESYEGRWGRGSAE